MFTKRILHSIVLSATALAMTSPALAQSPGFVKETAANLPKYNIYRPADLAQRTTPAPVIVWANGGCMKQDSRWASVLERWAAGGYVVVSINDPDAPPYVPSPEMIARAAGLPPPGAAPGAPADMPRSAQASNEVAKTSKLQGAAIDWAIAENSAKGSIYAGKFDTSRIVAAGNSCGGATSLLLASDDTRVKSVYVLTGSSIGGAGQPGGAAAIVGKITAPTLWIVGGPEDMAHKAAGVDFSVLPKAVPGAVVYRTSGTHGFMSSDEVLPDAAEIGLLWFRATLYGDRAAKQTLTSQICEQCDAKTWTIASQNLNR